MSSLTVTAQLANNNVPDGTTVEAWAASSFVVAPTPLTVPPGSATATGTTTSGAVTLSGLSAVAYYVRVWAPPGYATWTLVPASQSTITIKCQRLLGPNGQPMGPQPNDLILPTLASAGIADTFARSDHTHPTPSFTLPGTYQTYSPGIDTRYCCCVPANGNWVCGGTGGIATSANQGSSWTTALATFTCCAMYASGNTILAIGNASSLPQWTVSTDGGVTWAALTAFSSSLISSTFTVSTCDCIIAGADWFVAGGTSLAVAAPYGLVSSTNSGSSWATKTIIGGISCFALAFDGTYIYAVGNDTSLNHATGWAATPANQIAQTSAFEVWDNGNVPGATHGVAWIGGTSLLIVTPGSPGIGFGTPPAGTGGSSFRCTVGPSAVSAPVRARAFNSSLFAVVGTPLNAGAPSIAFTLNGGASWTSPSINPFSTEAYDCAFISATQLLVTGFTNAAAPTVAVVNL